MFSAIYCRLRATPTFCYLLFFYILRRSSIAASSSLLLRRLLRPAAAASCCGCGCVLLHSAGNFLLRCPSCRIPAIVGCYRGAFFAAVAYWAASELLLHAGCSGCDLLWLRSAAAAVFSCCGLLQLRNVFRGFCLARAELQWAAIGQLPSCEVFRFGLYNRTVEASGRCKLHRWGHEPRQSYIILFLLSLNPCTQPLACATPCTICTLLLLVHSHPLPPLWQFPFLAGTPLAPWNVAISRAPVHV